MALIIKGIHIEDFGALEIATIRGTNVDEIAPAAARATRNGAKVLEWRVDGFSDLDDTGLLREAIQMIGRFCDSAILIATIKTSAYGGDASLDEEVLVNLYDEIAQTHCADLLDVEIDSLGDKAGEIIDSLHARGQLILASSMDVNPDRALELMQKCDADVGRMPERNLWKIFI